MSEDEDQFSGNSVQPSDTDSRIIELKSKHELMESKIGELRELNKKRDEELRDIRDTIRECKDKVLNLRKTLGDESDQDESKKLLSWDFRNPGNWRVAAGLAFLYYLLNHNNCYRFVPNIPFVYSFFYLSIVFYHFVLVTGIPIVRGYVLQKGLDEGTFQRVDSLFLPWYYAIGMSLSSGALILHQIKCCTSPFIGWSIGPPIQALTIIASYIVELLAFSYPDLANYPNSEGCSVTMNKTNKITASLLALNILVSIQA